MRNMNFRESVRQCDLQDLACQRAVARVCDSYTPFRHLVWEAIGRFGPHGRGSESDLVKRHSMKP